MAEKHKTKNVILAEKLAKDMGLKKTRIKSIPEQPQGGLCQTGKKSITCYIGSQISKEDILHELNHALLAEQRMREENIINRIFGDIGKVDTSFVEEIETVLLTKRKPLSVCSTDVSESICGKVNPLHRLYLSIYGNKCICDKDTEFYKSIPRIQSPDEIFEIMKKYMDTQPYKDKPREKSTLYRLMKKEGRI